MLHAEKVKEWRLTHGHDRRSVSMEVLHAEQVKGKRLDLDTGIRTRSRAAAQREQFEAVPAPVQIFVLLADMLIEAREGALHSCLGATPTIHCRYNPRDGP